MGRPPVLGSTLSPNLTGCAMVLLLVSAERREHRVIEHGTRGHVRALNGKVIKHGTILARPPQSRAAGGDGNHRPLGKRDGPQPAADRNHKIPGEAERAVVIAPGHQIPVPATAETSTLTLSRVMMPWDWIGIVTIRSDTRRSTSTTGMIRLSPGAREPRSRPSRNSTPCSYCLTIRTASPNPSSASSTTTTTTAIKTPTATLRSGLVEGAPSTPSCPLRARQPPPWT